MWLFLHWLQTYLLWRKMLEIVLINLQVTIIFWCVNAWKIQGLYFLFVMKVIKCFSSVFIVTCMSHICKDWFNNYINDVWKVNTESLEQVCVFLRRGLYIGVNLNTHPDSSHATWAHQAWGLQASLRFVCIFKYEDGLSVWCFKFVSSSWSKRQKKVILKITWTWWLWGVLKT